MLDMDHALSLRRQCELIGLNRSSYYYQPTSESPLNLTLMRWIDEQYLQTPFYGYLKMTEHLRQTKKVLVNHKRVYRLMNQMGLQAVVPRPRTSQPGAGHKIYPYLLRGVKITRPNQVWSTDITYVPMQRGFMYLVAVLDWYSRYVLSWEVSNTQLPFSRPLSLVTPALPQAQVCPNSTVVWGRSFPTEVWPQAGAGVDYGVL